MHFLQQWERFLSVQDIFDIKSVGVVTARDSLTVGWSVNGVWDTVRAFSGMDPELARQAYRLGDDVKDWKVTLAQKDVLDSGPAYKRIIPMLYRPFDIRHTYYTGRSRGFLCRPRVDVMRHMLAGDNLALIAPKRVEHAGEWQHAFVTNLVSEHVAVSLKTIDYHFPLYAYQSSKTNGDSGRPPVDVRSAERRSNINPDLRATLRQAYGQECSSEEIFHFIYAVLNAPTYRKNYAELLRTNFPHIPFTTDREIVREVRRSRQKTN